MTRARVALALTLMLVASRAHAACPPHELLLRGVRFATRVQIEQLGSDASRIETPHAHLPGRTLGYEVEGVFRVSRPVAEALQRAFGRADSYGCEPEAPRTTFRTPGPLAVGLLFASRASAVAVVLHLPEGRVEIQLEGGVHASAPLSQAGQRRWEEALSLLARETHASPEEFYEQMRPAGEAGARSDSSRGHRIRVPRPTARGRRVTIRTTHARVPPS